MPITEQKKTQYHPTERNKVLATADVLLQQVQVVDKKGQIRSVIVWQCGSDILYANSMDGLFDIAQRRQAPDWLKEELNKVSNRYNYDGTSKSSPASYLPTSDEDAPEFVQG